MLEFLGGVLVFVDMFIFLPAIIYWLVKPRALAKEGEPTPKRLNIFLTGFVLWFLIAMIGGSMLPKPEKEPEAKLSSEPNESASSSEASSAIANTATVPTPKPKDISAADQEAIRKGCEAFGDMASRIVTDKQRGVSLPDEISTIQRVFASKNEPNAETFVQLANTLYTKKYAKGLSAEGAYSVFYIDCIGRVERIAAGGKSVTDQSDIALATEKFNAHNGEKLVPFLAKYNLKITAIDITPMSAMKASKPGDLASDDLYAMVIAGQPKTMPCGLKKQLTNGAKDAEFLAEATMRNGEFRIDPDSIDPVLYWAATGKCSAAHL